MTAVRFIIDEILSHLGNDIDLSQDTKRHYSYIRYRIQNPGAIYCILFSLSKENPPNTIHMIGKNRIPRLAVAEPRVAGLHLHLSGQGRPDRVEDTLNKPHFIRDDLCVTLHILVKSYLVAIVGFEAVG